MTFPSLITNKQTSAWGPRTNSLSIQLEPNFRKQLDPKVEKAALKFFENELRV